ncbi:hypothetical protein FRC09_002757 [Ceratobasidium sp. 395]|nr:hypothetical protein FRC09_002757 [Ceratobasidium sp. 395]
MSFVPPNEVVESPAAIQESQVKRPPLLGHLSKPSDGDSPAMTSSPSASASTFETGRTASASVRFPSTASAPDLTKLGHVPASHPNARRMSTAEMPQVIPPRGPNEETRTLVLCFDGTGDQFDQDNSNIVQFFQLLKKDDRKKQMVYYQAGIGTSSKHFVTPVGVALSKAADMAVAHGLSDHVTDGYEFLMQNYIEGDKAGLDFDLGNIV